MAVFRWALMFGRPSRRRTAFQCFCVANHPSDSVETPFFYTHSAAAWPAASRLVLCQNSAFGRGRMQATESQESILASDEPSKTPPPRIRFSVALVSLCTLVCGPGANRPKHVYRRVTTRKERVVQLPRAGPQRTGRAYNRRCRSARVTGQTSQRCLQRERRKN